MAIELADQRYIAGIVLEDATTQAPILLPLRLSSAQGSAAVRFTQNRRGVHVVTWVEGFETYVDTFVPGPTEPPAVSLDVLVEDPSSAYLPRRFAISLPRVIDPSGTPGDRVLDPVRVTMYRSAHAVTSANWATIYAVLEDEATGEPATNALVRVVPSDLVLGAAAASTGILIANDTGRGSTRGQVAISVTGIPAVIWGASELDTNTIEATLEVVAISPTPFVFDPDLFMNTPATNVFSDPLQLSLGSLVNAGTLPITVP